MAKQTILCPFGCGTKLELEPDPARKGWVVAYHDCRGGKAVSVYEAPEAVVKKHKTTVKKDEEEDTKSSRIDLHTQAAKITKRKE